MAASEHRLKVLSREGVLEATRVLHGAAHGWLSPDVPSRSALVLSPGADTEDGLLTVAEVGALRLGGGLVVLSACDTGLGPTLQGEGVLGLPSAFHLAGASNTVVTLWPVADDSTEVFMQHFYAALHQGVSPADALASAKRALQAHPLFGAPFFWAPFVLVGAG